MSVARTPRRGLTFAPSNHTYRLDGKPVPGVTTIIGVLDKPAIPRWAAKSVAEYVANNRAAVEHLYDLGPGPMVSALQGIPWQRRDDAGARGTAFHGYAERIMRGEEVDVPEPIVPLVEHALDFMETYGIRPVLTEAACGSREHWYAGTLDLVADQARGPRAIWDWKSGKAIYSGAVWQLNAYGHAEFYGLGGDEHPMADLGIEAAYGVNIRADGWDVHPLRYGPEVFAEFTAIRRVFDANRRANGDWRTPGSGYVGVSEQIKDAS